MAQADLTESTGGHALERRLRTAPDRWASALARRERALWGMVLLATLADVASTLAGLRLGLAEGNPLVAGILHDAGLAGFLGVKVLALGVGLGARVALPQFRVAVPLGLALPWAVAACVNVVLIASLA